MSADGTLLNMVRRRDPKRDKQRSMDERVDAWGENQKAARRNLPRKRAWTHRSYRRAEGAELRLGEDADPASIRRKPFRKWAGPTRADHLDRQETRRDSLEASPRRSEAARKRRATRRRAPSSDVDDAG